ncbi:Mth938-like domain-containing protein [Snodgrassella communis]|uniref:Mth938-like domain-containing protein n=1 Tax=Snodgrassella communis TaxID=2946699 RepID=UPI001EF531CB|nr:Mth938-like domain-containing protein [Snodgrassella communis]
MQIDEIHDKQGLWIEEFDTDKITINGQQYVGPVCITATEVIPLDKNTAEELTIEDFSQAIEEKPEVILIGTGSKHVFIHPRLTVQLVKKNIGVESMNTAAACRTFMVLRSEGRNVWAWLWPLTAES